MAHELTPASADLSAFHRTIVERLRKDISDLLPESALAGLVEQAVRETFFQPIRLPRQYGADEVRPSWFVAEVTKAAEPLLRQAVAEFVAQRQDVIQQAIDTFLSHERVTVLLVERLASMFESSVNRLTLR